MPATANLLITFDPSHVKKAQDEVKVMLKQAGEAAKFIPSKIEGIFLLRTKKKPRDLVKSLRKLAKGKGYFTYTYRWVPVDAWVKTDLKSLGKAVKALEKKIDPANSWKLELSVRHYEKYGQTELILKLTEHIDRPKVDLDNPDVIVKIEILGSKTGVSLLAADEILDTQKLK